MGSKQDSLWITIEFDTLCGPFFQFYSLLSWPDTVVVFSKYTYHVILQYMAAEGHQIFAKFFKKLY